MFFKKNKHQDNSAFAKDLKVKPDNLELCLRRFSPNTRLDSNNIDISYRVVLDRARTVLRNAGKSEIFIENLFSEFEKMMVKRRGLRWPSKLDAQDITRYREITSFSLTMVLLTKVIAACCVGGAVQVEHEGDIYSYAFYQDFLYEKYKRIGIVRDRDNVTLSSDVLVSIRLTVFNDLHMRSALSLSWYAMFPDMLRLVFRSLQNSDDSLFTRLADEFIDRIMQTASTNKGAAQPIPEVSSDANKATASKSKEISEVVGEGAERKALKPSAALSGLLAKVEGAKNSPSVVNVSSLANDSDDKEKKREEVSTSEQRKQAPVVLGRSKAMDALLKNAAKAKAQTSPDNDSEIIDLETISNDCLREVYSKKNQLSLCQIVDDNGELVIERGLVIPADIWRNIVKKRLEMEKGKVSLLDVDNFLIKKDVLAVSDIKSAVLQSQVQAVIVIKIDNLPESENISEILNKPSQTLSISNLSLS